MNGKYLYLVAALILAALIAPVSAEVVFYDDFSAGSIQGTYTEHKCSDPVTYSVISNQELKTRVGGYSGGTTYYYLVYDYTTPDVFQMDVSMRGSTANAFAGVTYATTGLEHNNMVGFLLSPGTTLKVVVVENGAWKYVSSATTVNANVNTPVSMRIDDDGNFETSINGSKWVRHPYTVTFDPANGHPFVGSTVQGNDYYYCYFDNIAFHEIPQGIPLTVSAINALSGYAVHEGGVTVYNAAGQVVDNAVLVDDVATCYVPYYDVYTVVVNAPGYDLKTTSVKMAPGTNAITAFMDPYTAPSDFAVEVYPTEGAVGKQHSAFVVGDSLPAVAAIVHVIGNAAYYTSDGESGWGETVSLRKINGTWYQRNETSYEYTIPVRDPYSYTFAPLPASGQYKHTCLLRAANNDALYQKETFVTAGQSTGYTFVLPEHPAPGFGITAWLQTSDTSFSLADRVFYTLGDTEYFASNLERGWGSTIGFKMVDGTWYRYNDVSLEFDIPVDDPRSASFAPFPHVGTYKFMGYVMSPHETLYEQTDILTVGNPDDVATVTVYVKDAETGALIAGANVTITGPAGVLIGTQVTASGIATFDVPKTTYPEYWVTVTATDYTQVSPHLMAVMQDIGVTIEMNPEGEPPADPNNVYLQFVVRDHNLNPVSGASITVGGVTLTTNDAGFVRFEVAKSTRHTYLVSKAGYMTVSGSVDAGTLSPVNMPVVLTSGLYPTSTVPTSTVPTGQPTGQPTGEPTGQPTGQPTPGTSFVNQSAQGFATLLGVSFEMGKAALGIVIASAVGFATARQLRGGAAEFGIGMLAGACLAVIMGLLPVWIFIVLMMAVGALLGYRYMGGGQ